MTHQLFENIIQEDSDSAQALRTQYKHIERIIEQNLRNYNTFIYRPKLSLQYNSRQTQPAFITDENFLEKIQRSKHIVRRSRDAIHEFLKTRASRSFYEEKHTKVPDFIIATKQPAERRKKDSTEVFIELSATICHLNKLKRKKTTQGNFMVSSLSKNA